MKLALLEEAHIVCSTLSFSGSPIFAKMSRKFDVVVIDEAAQAVEPAILVPLVQGVKQVSIHLVSSPEIRMYGHQHKPTILTILMPLLQGLQPHVPAAEPFD